MVRFSIQIDGKTEEWRLADSEYAKEHSWDMSLPTVKFNLQGRKCLLQRYKGSESAEEALRTGKILTKLNAKFLRDMECGFLHTLGKMNWNLWEEAFVIPYKKIKDSPLQGEILEVDWPEPPWKGMFDGLQPDGSIILY